MTSAYFVTATGTDLGKTYVLCRMIEQLRARGLVVDAVKPVLSGFHDAQAVDSDAGRILQALGLPCEPGRIAAMAPWRFREPLSPDMAAARERRVVRLDDVAQFCRSRFSAPDGIAFVEGAGGVLSPLGQDFTNLDLVQALGCSSVLVAGGYLGTISHTLTAVAAMKARQCPIMSIVLSGAQAGPVSLAETAATIARFCDVPIHSVDRGACVPDALLELLQVKA